MAAQPGLGRFLHDLVCRPLIHDLEAVGQADQPGPLADDVVSQAVERAYPVAQVGQQATTLDEVGHPRSEVVHGRVDQRDDQHFLLVLQPPTGDQLGGQGRQRERLPAARYRRDAHAAVGVIENFLLLGAGLEFYARPPIQQAGAAGRAG